MRIRGGVAAAVFATAGIIGLSLPTAVAASSPTMSSHLSSAAIPAAGKPIADITGSGSALKFKPGSIAIKWSGSTQGTCTTANYSFKAVNKTTASQTLTYKGTAIGPAIAAGKAELVCAWGTGSTTLQLSLKADTKALLTLHVT